MVYATIMAGGAGTRFWPASRKATPKQLLNLAGDRSMIQATVDRLGGLVDENHLLIVTNTSLVEPISKQLPQVPRDAIIGEPAKRDTAPCIGLAAAWIAAQDPDATMIVMPADHVIGPVDRFQAALQHAVQIVENDPQQIVTLGIKPDHPAETFGYIERTGTSDPEAPFPTFPVKQFREKPDAPTAQAFLEAGSFYWNSGIFIWKAQTILEALAQYEPQMFQHLQTIGQAVGTSRFQEVLTSEFTAIEGKSIDYAVMEHYPSVQVIEAPFQWDDLGSWSAVPRLEGTDSNGNTIKAKHFGIATDNAIIQGTDDHLIVTLGVKDLIIVQTDDVTLIVNKQDEPKIKQIVSELENKGWHEYL